MWRSGFRTHMYPALGHIKLRALKTVHCQKMIKTVWARKATPTTLRTYLSAVLNFAARSGYTTFGNVENVMKGIVLPKRRPTEVVVFTLEQLYAFLKALLWREIKGVVKPPPKFGRHWELTKENAVSAILFLITTGARGSEASGLQWENAGQIDGKYKIANGYNEKDKKKGTKKGKTYRGSIHPAYRRSLIPIWERQGRPSTGYVYISRFGNPISADNISAVYYRAAMREAGLVKENNQPIISMHKLRHTFVSLEWARGTPPLEIAKKVCQTPAIMMATYSHVFEDDPADAKVWLGMIDQLLADYANCRMPQRLAAPPRLKRD